jgi:hypothetical protein
MPIKDAMDNLGTMQPFKSMGRPRIVMLPWLLSGKLIVIVLLQAECF